MLFADAPSNELNEKLVNSFVCNDFAESAHGMTEGQCDELLRNEVRRSYVMLLLFHLSMVLSGETVGKGTPSDVNNVGAAPNVNDCLRRVRGLCSVCCDLLPCELCGVFMSPTYDASINKSYRIDVNIYICNSLL